MTILSATSIQGDRMHDECGVFGIFGTPDAAAHTALGLHALQHRGQESAGIAAFDGTKFHVHKGTGLVSDVLASEPVIDALRGDASIGHNRYSTSGDTTLRNVQPIFVETFLGGMAFAHNGNLTNANMVRKDLVKRGAIFQTTSDTETIVHLVALSDMAALEDRLVEALNTVIGAYALVVLSETSLIGIRDPLGVRPLVLGKLGRAWILASETCALDIMDATYVRDIEPGEMVVVNDKGVHSYKPFARKDTRFCIFEYIYFARPDSRVEGKNAFQVRKKLGQQLAYESAHPADIVVPVPDSGVPAAMGFAETVGLPFTMGVIRNHYVGRTFIQPSHAIRHLGVKLKHNANRGELDGKRVILVDDSLVRGTTSTKIVNMVRNAGATEVHMRIASPPNTNSCHYGVDTPTKRELLASSHSVPEMAKFIGVDSLQFLSLDGLYKATGELSGRDQDRPQYCDACLTGDYPVPLVDRDGGVHMRQPSLLDEIL